MVSAIHILEVSARELSAQSYPHESYPHRVIRTRVIRTRVIRTISIFAETIIQSFVAADRNPADPPWGVAQFPASRCGILGKFLRIFVRVH